MGLSCLVVNSFVEKLYEGQLGEGRIAQWFTQRGFAVLPAYEIELDHRTSESRRLSRTNGVNRPRSTTPTARPAPLGPP